MISIIVIIVFAFTFWYALSKMKKIRSSENISWYSSYVHKTENEYKDGVDQLKEIEETGTNTIGNRKNQIPQEKNKK